MAVARRGARPSPSLPSGTLPPVRQCDGGIQTAWRARPRPEPAVAAARPGSGRTLILCVLVFESVGFTASTRKKSKRNRDVSTPLRCELLRGRRQQDPGARAARRPGQGRGQAPAPWSCARRVSFPSPDAPGLCLRCGLDDRPFRRPHVRPCRAGRPSGILSSWGVTRRAWGWTQR